MGHKATKIALAVHRAWTQMSRYGVSSSKSTRRHGGFVSVEFEIADSGLEAIDCDQCKAMLNDQSRRTVCKDHETLSLWWSRVTIALHQHRFSLMVGKACAESILMTGDLGRPIELLERINRSFEPDLIDANIEMITEACKLAHDAFHGDTLWDIKLIHIGMSIDDAVNSLLSPLRLRRKLLEDDLDTFAFRLRDILEDHIKDLVE